MIIRNIVQQRNTMSIANESGSWLTYPSAGSYEDQQKLTHQHVRRRQHSWKQLQQLLVSEEDGHIPYAGVI